MKNMQLAAPLLRTLGSARATQWLGLMFGLLLLGLLALPARAAEEPDPPDRAGRLAELNGQVWIYATDSNEWIPAVRNRPVTSGDRLSTEADGRAELRIGSTVLRVAPNTELEIRELNDQRLSLQLHSGSMSARLRTREAANEFELVTEEGRFRAERSGSYRFDRIDDTSSATALSGQATYENDGTALTVQQGQRVEFWKDRGAPQYAITDPQRDGFGDWVTSREAREERSVSSRYVSPEMTGVEDLDRYGRWEQNAEYGPLWIPVNVAPGWAPYRMGHWAWVRPWGWTWVDDAPWGFAPFHYGRWVYHRSAWCWTPGRYVARPVYAPALVAWVGGPNVSVSVNVGRGPNVGWFPLGPREVYVPGYRVSPRYVRNVNGTHVTNITNVTTIINNPAQFMAGTRYVNRGLSHAVTVVPSGVVERRQPVAPAFRPVNERELRDMRGARPRADAPVVAPPRFTPGSRQVVDPRVSRPGFTARPAPPRVAPGVTSPQPSRETTGNGPAFTRPQERDRRGRDNPPSTVPVAPVNAAPPANAMPAARPPAWSSRDNDSRANRPPPVQAEPPRAQPSPSPLPSPRQGGFQGNTNPPPVGAPPRPTVPDRALAPPPDERKRHHEMPGPPRAAVQAPPARVAPPPPLVRPPPVQAPPVQVAPPPPVVRPPVVQRPQVTPPPPRETQPPPQQPQVRQRGREDERERSNDRFERGERGERR